MRRPFLLFVFAGLALSTLFSACTRPMGGVDPNIPPLPHGTSTSTPTLTPTDTPAPIATDTPTWTPTVTRTSTPSPTLTPPAHNTPTPTPTGCDKVNVTVDPLPVNPVSAGTTVIGLRFLLGNYFGMNCPAYNHSFTGMSFSPGFPTGNLASEFVEAQLWRGSSLATGTLIATSSSIGPAFSGAPVLGSDGPYFLAYVFSPAATGVIQTSLYGLSGYGTGGGSIWVPNPPSLPVAGAPLTIGATTPTPIDTPTATPTRTPALTPTPGLGVICTMTPGVPANGQTEQEPNGNDVGPGDPGSFHYLTATWPEVVVTGNLGPGDPQDAFHVNLVNQPFGEPRNYRFILDCYDDGGGAVPFDFEVHHYMGAARNGPFTTAPGVLWMDPPFVFTDGQVIVTVRANGGSGSYRLTLRWMPPPTPTATPTRTPTPTYTEVWTPNPTATCAGTPSNCAAPLPPITGGGPVYAWTSAYENEGICGQGMNDACGSEQYFPTGVSGVYFLGSLSSVGNGSYAGSDRDLYWVENNLLWGGWQAQLTCYGGNNYHMIVDPCGSPITVGGPTYQAEQRTYNLGVNGGIIAVVGYSGSPGPYRLAIFRPNPTPTAIHTSTPTITPTGVWNTPTVTFTPTPTPT